MRRRVDIALNPLWTSGRIGICITSLQPRWSMTHIVRVVVAVAVLMALVGCVPVQAQTPEIDALREGDRRITVPSRSG